MSCEIDVAMPIPTGRRPASGPDPYMRKSLRMQALVDGLQLARADEHILSLRSRPVDPDDLLAETHWMRDAAPSAKRRTCRGRRPG
jgi:hypothetical protein